MDATIALSDAERACVPKLKKHEDALRQQLNLPPELERSMLRDPALFMHFRQWTLNPQMPYGSPRFSGEPGTEMHAYTTYPNCAANEEEGYECGVYSVSWLVEGLCIRSAAG